MDFNIEKCEKKCIELGIKKAMEVGLFGALSDDVAEEINKVKVQTRSFYYFKALDIFGTFEINEKILTISRNCPKEYISLVVLHEVLHIIEDFTEAYKRYDGDTKKYKDDLEAFLQENMGAAYDILCDRHRLFSWAFYHEDMDDNTDNAAAYIRTTDFIRHGNFFWHMSLRCDILLDWPLGSTIGYGCDIAVADILDKQESLHR